MADTTLPGNHLPKRIPALNGVRGLAIALVLIAHCLSQPLSYAASRPGGWRYDLWHTTQMFWSGVDLFFVLSGFLITKIILENRNSPQLFRVFYTRRAGRILPLYYAVVASMLLLPHLMAPSAAWDWLFAGQYSGLTYATLTQNFFMGWTSSIGGNALAVTWSLCIEEQFYLVLPFVLRFVPTRYLPWLFASGLPCAWLVRANWHDDRSYYFALAHADALMLGCLLAWCCLQPGAYSWLSHQGRGLTWLLLVLAAGLVRINQMPTYYSYAGESWLALFFGTLVLIAATQPGHLVSKFLAQRWLGFLGLISYGMYLLHRPIQALVCWQLQHSTPIIGSAHDLYIPVVVLGLTFAAASLSWFLYEKHWVKLGHRVKF